MFCFEFILYLIIFSIKIDYICYIWVCSLFESLSFDLSILYSSYFCFRFCEWSLIILHVLFFFNYLFFLPPFLYYLSLLITFYRLNCNNYRRLFVFSFVVFEIKEYFIEWQLRRIGWFARINSLHPFVRFYDRLHKGLILSVWMNPHICSHVSGADWFIFTLKVASINKERKLLQFPGR